MVEMIINEEKKITYREQRFINLFIAIAFGLFFIAINTFFISIWLGKIYNSKYDKNINSASAQSINEISNYDTITDLTGTSWGFNSSIIPIIDGGQARYYINFTSNGNNYQQIYSEDADDYELGYGYDWVYVYNFRNNTWSNNVYKNIQITGGTHATNSTLISWLQSNATQIQTGPTQLTTPTLQSALDVQNGVDLYWTYDSSISTPYSFEIYKDNTLLTTTNSSFYTITSNGIYKVRQLGDNNSYTDSEFSNEITISGLTHFTYNLGNGISAETTCSTNGTTLNTTFSYSSFYLLLDENFNTELYPITYYRIYNTDDNTINGTLLENGYVFNSVNDLTTDSDIQYYSSFNTYQSLTFRLLELNTNSVNISVSSHYGKLISGNTYIYDTQLSNYELSIGDYLLKDKTFTSNNNAYDNIFVNNYNYLVYDNDTTVDNDTTYFLSNLSGQYISNSTYNYMLISIGSDYIQNSFIKDYLPTDDIFFDFYRLATQSDYDNITALNNQLININENYTFLSLFGSIIDAHFNTIKSLMNFNFFGINLWSIFTLFLTLTLIFIVFKFLRGGGKKE